MSSRNETTTHAPETHRAAIARPAAPPRPRGRPHQPPDRERDGDDQGPGQGEHEGRDRDLVPRRRRTVGDGWGALLRVRRRLARQRTRWSRGVYRRRASWSAVLRTSQWGHGRDVLTDGRTDRRIVVRTNGRGIDDLGRHIALAVGWRTLLAGLTHRAPLVCGPVPSLPHVLQCREPTLTGTSSCCQRWWTLSRHSIGRAGRVGVAVGSSSRTEARRSAHEVASAPTA